MCNRYTLIDPDGAFAEIARILGVPLHKPAWVVKRYNIAPTNVVPAVVNRGGGAEIMPLHFGFFAKGNPQMVPNARAETVYAKRSFKDAVPSHRCAIPTTGFIDWRDEDGHKWPYLFTRADDRPFALAALWSSGDAARAVPPNFCIVTTEPNEVVAPVHNRMPVILREEHLARWLDPAPMAEPEFQHIAEKLPAAALAAREVDDFINSVKHEGPECLGPPKPRGAQLGLGF